MVVGTDDGVMQMAHSNASKDIVDQNHILEAVPFESSSQADLPATEDEEPLADRSNLRVFAILAALYVSLFIAALDQLIVATSLPTISAYFDSASGYTWVGSAYLLAQAASAPIWAKLSDIWGRKPILLSAVGLFFASSIVCAASRSMTMLITGRAFQGTAAGGISVLVVIVICDLFSPRKRSLYLGSLELVWGTASGTGPILGGLFAEKLSWRFCWWINLPFAGTAFAILLVFLNVHNPRTRVLDGMRAIDWAGCLCVLGLTLMFLLGLDFGGAIFPWNSPKVVCLIVFGVLMGGLFFAAEKKVARYPLVPLEMFKVRSNLAALIVCFGHGFSFGSSEYYLPLYFQSVRQSGPLHSGVLILPLLITASVVGGGTGLYVHKTGRYHDAIWLGTASLTLGFGLMVNLDAFSNLGKIIGYQIVVGIGAGCLFQPPLLAIQALVSQEDTATASAVFGFTRDLASSMTVVIGGVVFQNRMQGQRGELVAAGLPSNITTQLSGTHAAANVGIIKTVSDVAQRNAIKQAYATSLSSIWILMCAVAGCAVIATFFIGSTNLRIEHVETKTGLTNIKKRGGREDHDHELQVVP